MDTWKKAAFTKIALAAGAIVIGYGAWVTWNRLFAVEAEPDLTYQHLDGAAFSPNYLLEIPIYGFISVDAADPSLFWLNEGTYSAHVRKVLQQAAQDDRVKGILLRLNTGGGSTTGADAIYNALVNYRKFTNKPVVAHIEEISLSGGVMAMMGADAIYAAPGSSIGNIGVVGERWLIFDKPTSYSDSSGRSITNDAGLEWMIISAGKGKDLLHADRLPTAEEKKVMQKNVDNDYTNFVKLVSKARNIPEKTIRHEMGAYVFDNAQAEQYKLIDGTKHRDDAIAELANRAKLGENFRVVRAKEPARGLLQLGTASTLTYDQKRQMLSRDRCATAQSATLLYSGNIKELCSVNR